MKKIRSALIKSLTVFMMALCLASSSFAASPNTDTAPQAVYQNAASEQQEHESIEIMLLENEEEVSKPKPRRKLPVGMMRIFTGFFIAAMGFLMYGLISADKKLKK